MVISRRSFIISRIPQPPGRRGSLKWIQTAIAEKWPSLEAPILRALPDAKRLRWLSPLEDDGFAEYRDAAFLELCGAGHLSAALKEFWPARGPQWDALACSDAGHVLLIEAKAHIPEMCSPGSQAAEHSRRLIQTSLHKVSTDLKARAGHAPWDQFFYQFANRIAHLWWLRRHDVDACLVMVNFVGDSEMGGPATSAEWDAAYTVAMHVLGLPSNHPLSRNILHVHPDVAHHSEGTSNE